MAQLTKCPARWKTTEPIWQYACRTVLRLRNMINNPMDRCLQNEFLSPQTMADKLPVSVTIILPTRNEEEALGPTVDSIPRDWCDELEIMIVDGNSTDKTREIALEKGILHVRQGIQNRFSSLLPWMRLHLSCRSCS